jgi:hypothetical protein
MLTTVSGLAEIVVVLFALFLIGLACVAFVKPAIAERFFSAFASSARTHYTEQAFRLLIGASLVVIAPAMWQANVFRIVGWIIVFSSAGLLLIPWRWHHRFGQRVMPLVLRHLRLYAVGLTAFGVLLLVGVFCGSRAFAQRPEVTNPYERVDWATFSHYKADLHVHTIQSDGCHHPEEVVRVYREAGFSILAITDHDSVSPNQCPARDAASPQQISIGLFTEAPSPYPDPRPANFPADTTWPWTDYGAPSPAELGILGIEGVELTCGHHRNAFFIDYGVIEPCAPSINEQFQEVARRGGLAFINHPEPRFKEWYYELYRDNSADYLVGLEISRGVDDATAVWDQLLADLMPSRPVWGFATADMHLFKETQFAFTVFLLDELTMEETKEAMRAGRFYSVVGPGTMDLREVGRAAYDGTYPELRSISVDRDAAEISIDAANYDEIVWITGRSAWRYRLDPEKGVTWPAGEIIHRGAIFNYSNTEASLPYVRAELWRDTENGPVRLLLNPFALVPP